MVAFAPQHEFQQALAMIAAMPPADRATCAELSRRAAQIAAARNLPQQAIAHLTAAEAFQPIAEIPIETLLPRLPPDAPEPIRLARIAELDRIHAQQHFAEGHHEKALQWLSYAQTASPAEGA